MSSHTCTVHLSPSSISTGYPGRGPRQGPPWAVMVHDATRWYGAAGDAVSCYEAGGECRQYYTSIRAHWHEKPLVTAGTTFWHVAASDWLCVYNSKSETATWHLVGLAGTNHSTQTSQVGTLLSIPEKRELKPDCAAVWENGSCSRLVTSVCLFLVQLNCILSSVICPYFL